MQLTNEMYQKSDALEMVQELTEVKIRFQEKKISMCNDQEEMKSRQNRINVLRQHLADLQRDIQQSDGEICLNSFLELNSKSLSNQEFSLINGSFELDDAREILVQAFNAKISFHKIKAWSKYERGESGVSAHNHRSLELQQTKARIKELLQSNSENGQKLNIKCNVVLDFVSDEMESAYQSNLAYSPRA